MNALRMGFRSYLKIIFAVDARSLGLLRIGLGLVSIYNLVLFYPNIELFFGPLGVFPVWELNPLTTFSIHTLNDSRAFIDLIFLIHLIFSVMLCVGYKTRLATISCWLLTVSLFNRAPQISFGGDEILRALLLWGIFLPLGQRFSIDAIKNKKPIMGDRVVSLAGAALIIQIIIVYLVNGFGKNDLAWATDFTALYYFFNDTVAKAPAKLLLEFPEMLMLLTCLTLYLERFASLLLLLPNVLVFRTAAIILFLIFHLCIDVTLKVGWFSWIMIIYWLALIPSECWKGKPADRTENKQNSNRATNVLCGVLLGMTVISNFFYMQNAELKALWKNSIFFKTLHYAAIDQDLLKFMPVGRVRRTYTVNPVFESSQKIDTQTLKKYTFNRTPYFRVGRIIHWRGSAAERLRRYDYLKRYMLHYWSNQFPDGPRINDVVITVTSKKILPNGNHRLLSVESF